MSFFTDFCNELKITDKNNSIKLKEWSVLSNTFSTRKFDIFKEDSKGNVDILVYTIEKETILIDHKDANPLSPNANNNRSFNMSIKRLAEPREYTDPKTGKTRIIKYEFPKKAGTFPFFPPKLVDLYEKKQQFDTLILTEGYKKAWYASLFNAPVVGLSSITHYKDKETKAMYDDVIKIIKTCKVKNLIMLYDGDYSNISIKALDDGEDLYTRPYGFYNACCTVRELFKDFKIDVYFGAVNSESIETQPKGLDDIFIAMQGNETKLVDDLLSLSKPSFYFTKLNITNSTKKLADLFNFEINSFYRKHSDIIKYREFVFRGSKYKFDELKQEINIVTPAEAKLYFRVGDDYYKYVKIPNKYGQLEHNYHKRQKTTINEDHGKKIFNHIQKYEAFCNVPSHVNHATVISNCFNLYYKLENEPEPGECNTTLDFIHHIFGEQYELGLDYIQILYQMPTQILPILCLVSKENKTGKSTFIKFMKAIFEQNATIIGNEQFNTNFNASWGSKLLICCEESFVEKMATVEKIKSLSTGDKVQLEKKGKDANEIDFFGKFILASNRETNFIYANRDDIRYWVVKVPTIKKENVRLNYELIDEIPAFLDFLNKRTLSTKNESRMWFKESLIFTDALKKLQNANRPKAEILLTEKLKTLFIDSRRTEIMMPLKHIREILLENTIKDEDYLRRTIEDLKCDRYKNKTGKYDSIKVSIPFYDAEGSINFKTERCRPYVFLRDKFITPEDYELLETEQPNLDDQDDMPEFMKDKPVQQKMEFETTYTKD